MYHRSCFTLTVIITTTFFFFCSERVHLHPRGSGRCPDRKCLLGAVLPRAWRRSWRRLPGQSHTTELSWRPVQHLLQHWELWSSCPQSVICGPGAHCGWWVVLCVCLFLPSLSVFFIIIIVPAVLLCVAVWVYIHTVHAGNCGWMGTLVSKQQVQRWLLYLLFNTA